MVGLIQRGECRDLRVVRMELPGDETSRRDDTMRSMGQADKDFVEMLGGELPRIQRVARVLAGSPEAADDLVADAIVRVLPKWRTGSVIDPPAYLRRAVVNLATKRWRVGRLATARDHRALDWLLAPVDATAAVDERDRTLRAVMRLPVRRRAVVVLRFYEDLTEQAIAETLGIDVGTVKSQLARALKQLRADLGGLE